MVKQKKFNCPNCGLIDGIYANMYHGSATKFVSFDENGDELEEFDNFDFDESDGYYCNNCSADVDDDVIEVEVNDGKNTTDNSN